MTKMCPPEKLFVTLLALASSLGAWGAGPPPANSNSATAAAPTIQFGSTNYDFGWVLEGEPVNHVFTFTNVGTGDLVVKRVMPGCGCTRVGNWTRLVKPGETGMIPIQLNTGGLVGAVDKTIGVVCNDTKQPLIPLQLKGSARRAVEIRPSTAFLNLTPDRPFGQATVWITNCLDQPLLLSAAQGTNGYLVATLKTNLLGHDYALIVSNTAPLPPGTFTVSIPLRASLTNLPRLDILAVANTTPTFTVAPDRINVSPAPLATGQVAYVSILNNSTNPTTLSDARLTATGTRVELKETKPGTDFTAMIYFPPGFRLPAGRPQTLSIKTGHPQCPVVEVPVSQLTNATPTAPVIKRTMVEVVSAPLPLIFQRDAIAKLRFDSDQQEAIGQLRERFIEAIGGLSQDPGDPAYLARWQQAQRSSDASLAGEIGRTGVIRLDQALSAPEAEGH